ncbi:MAG: GNAT family N-acetyltransferase [Spirulinaceae cyanobacterium]
MTTSKSPYNIVSAQPHHLNNLPIISLAATAIFSEADIPAHLRQETIPLSTFAKAQKEGLLWVAVEEEYHEVVGFALLSQVLGYTHLKELSVHPQHGRRGVGTSLIKSAIAWAKAQDIPTMTLTTFSHLPWNAPFYQKLGFKIIPEAELNPQLREIWQQEAENFDKSKRVVMSLNL